MKNWWNHCPHKPGTYVTFSFHIFFHWFFQSFERFSIFIFAIVHKCARNVQMVSRLPGYAKHISILPARYLYKVLQFAWVNIKYALLSTITIFQIASSATRLQSRTELSIAHSRSTILATYPWDPMHYLVYFLGSKLALCLKICSIDSYNGHKFLFGSWQWQLPGLRLNMPKPKMCMYFEVIASHRPFLTQAFINVSSIYSKLCKAIQKQSCYTFLGSLRWSWPCFPSVINTY